MKKEIKIKVGKYLYPVVLFYQDNRIFVSFRYNERIIAEIKNMEGHKWHGREDPPRKIWSISDTPRNEFQLAYLEGKNPYASYDAELIKHDFERPLYEHQKEFVDFILTRQYCIIAGEMGVGKTLSAIEVLERIESNGYWYIAPKSALKAVERELRIWKSKVMPVMMTYEKLVKWAKENEGHEINANNIPGCVIFDESARIKNPTAQRSQASKNLADAIRIVHGDKGYVILMSGAPAPKSPLDWWHQAEVACPGYLVEGTRHKFQKRLGIVTQQEFYDTGKTFPKLESWLDDETKCAVCGKYAEDHSVLDLDSDHKYTPSVNEVSYLYERMAGLVLVKLKKDCLDLPDKHYRTIVLEPSRKILNVAKSLVQSARTTIAGITALRTLSDGFQYRDEEDGTVKCTVCKGNKSIPDPLDPLHVSNIPCDGCGGVGTKKKYKRVTEQVESPKAKALRDLLDEYFDIGRVVIFAGFMGSVDRCVQICQDNGWKTIRVDGRGWQHEFNDPLEAFQEGQEEHPHVAYIGNPGSGGLGLTLTASPVIIYYSNDFNADSRIQSEDRIHRPGMDYNLGATIIDLVHLPTDELILENLKKKRELQSLSMGELQRALE